MHLSKVFRRIAPIGIAMTALCSTAFAQSYPNKPIRLVVAFGAGGITDVVNRIAADEMGKRLGQPVLVENRPGGNTVIGAAAVKNASPDGYTLFGGGATTFSPVFVKDNPILASRELTPISVVAFGDWFAYVPTSLGVTTLKDLATWANANPGKFRSATPSANNEMMVAVLAKRLGIRYENIPYKSTDQTIASMINGDTQITVNGAAGFAPHIQSGKLRAIAVLAPSRLSNQPDVPTSAEQGYPIEMRFNIGIWGPGGMTRDVVMKLNSVVAESVKNPTVIEKIRNVSMLAASTTPEDLLRSFESELNFFKEAAQLTGFVPQ